MIDLSLYSTKKRQAEVLVAVSQYLGFCIYIHCEDEMFIYDPIGFCDQHDEPFRVTANFTLPCEEPKILHLKINIDDYTQSSESKLTLLTFLKVSWGLNTYGIEELH